MAMRAETGRALALELARLFPATDWIAELARRAGVTRDTVEWHLQEDVAPPAAILRAAEELARSGMPDDGARQTASAPETRTASHEEFGRAGVQPAALGKPRRWTN